jgi:hypothetical protein
VGSFIQDEETTRTREHEGEKRERGRIGNERKEEYDIYIYRMLDKPHYMDREHIGNIHRMISIMGNIHDRYGEIPYQHLPL